jgi:putative ABC transport system permease protein
MTARRFPVPILTERVPLARRALFQDRRRAGLAASGVAAALLLVLMLRGIFDGSIQQVTSYLRQSPAAVFVSEKNVRTMHMSVSTLAPTTPAALQNVEGVEWAEGIRYTTTFLVAADGHQQLSYVIGYDTATGRGGPGALSAGGPPGRGEIVIERVAADRLGVGIGGTLSVFGTAFRISGLFRGGTTITNSIAFIRTEDFAARRGDAFAYVLVGAGPGVSDAELADRIARALPGQTVQTREEFVREEASLVTDMSGDILQIMSIVGFLIALAVIGLTLSTLTLGKLREHAIVKALGGRTRRLAGVVLGQAAWSVLVALALATGAAGLLGAVIGRLNPAVAIAIEPGSILRVGLAALVIGALGAIAPLRRVATVDPASAFRRTS